jgi:hypothetical protein
MIRKLDHQLINKLVKRDALLGNFYFFIIHTCINIFDQYNSSMKNKTSIYKIGII